MSELVGPAQWPKPGSGGTGGGTGTVTDVASPDTSLLVTTPHSTVKLRVENSPRIDGVHVTGTPSAGEVITATSATTAHWAAGGGGGITEVTNATGTIEVTNPTGPVVRLGEVQGVGGIRIAGALTPNLVGYVLTVVTQATNKRFGLEPGGGAWGAAGTARFTFAGDPNGQITSVSEGDLCVDTATPALYQALAAGTTRWQLVGGSGGGADLTVNNGPVVSSGLLPLAITSQPLVPPSAVLQPEPPLFGFQFTGAAATLNVVPTGHTIRGVCAARDGKTYFVVRQGATKALYRVDPAVAAPATTAGEKVATLPAMTAPNAICQGSTGAFYIATAITGQKLCKVTPTGTVTVLTVGPATSTYGICAAADDNVYLGGDQRLFRIKPTGTITAFGALTGGPYWYDVCAGPNGSVYAVSGNGGGLYKVTTTTGTPNVVQVLPGATLWPPTRTSAGVTTDAYGHIWVAWVGAAYAKVTRVDPTTGAHSSVNVGTGTALEFIRPGPGGDLWVGSTTGIWKVTVELVPTKFTGPEARWPCVASDGSFVASTGGHSLSRWPFQVVMGGVVLTGLATADPTNPGEVWADNGTLVQSGHTAAVGLPQASVTAPSGPTFPLTITTTYPTTTGIRITATGTPHLPYFGQNFKIAPGTYTDWSTLLPAVQAALDNNVTVPLSHYLTATVTGTKLVLTWKAVTGSTGSPTWSGVGTKGNGYYLTGSYQTRHLGFNATTVPRLTRTFVNVGTAYSKRQIYTALPTTDPSNPGETFSPAGVLLQSPFTPQAVTGSRLSGAALTSLLAALVALGLITNTTTT